MGCLNVFLAAFLVCFVVGVAVNFLSGREAIWKWIREERLLTWIIVACALVALGYFFVFLLWNLFGRSGFRIASHALHVEKRLFFWRRVKTIHVSTMKSLEQIKDGGEGDDSFPSWGLRLVAERQFTLLFRQPIEKSDWLGLLLSQAFKIPYIP